MHTAPGQHEKVQKQHQLGLLRFQQHLLEVLRLQNSVKEKVVEPALRVCLLNDSTCMRENETLAWNLAQEQRIRCFMTFDAFMAF